MSELSDATSANEPPASRSADLVRRAARGEPGAFARLYDAHVDKVHRFVAYKVFDEMLAADLTQDIFVNALKSLPRLGRASRFEPWLMRIARNRVANHWRSVSRRPMQVNFDGESGGAGAVHQLDRFDSAAAGIVDHPVQDSLDQVERGIDHAALGVVIGRLSEAKQDVIALRFGSGFTAKETAAILGRSEDAVKKLQARALADIREAIR